MEQRTIFPPGQFDDRYLTVDFVTTRLAAYPSGAGAPGAVASDFTLNPAFRPTAPLRSAAVLVPLIAHPGGLTVLLTQRTGHLANHAGQVSFPGGRTDEGDADAIATALRETYEEVGLPPERIRVIGQMSLYTTVTHFAVTPIVGLIRPPLVLMPDPFEVAEAFEVPLGHLVDPANCRIESRVTPEGVTRRFYVFTFEERRIWGATAAMLVNLAAMLVPPADR
jgi:8-oxo-dGTP pyrophosphatase MutT (NUDIX family)